MLRTTFMHRHKRDISTYPQDTHPACYLISTIRFATLMWRTKFEEPKRFLSSDLRDERKESNLCAIIRLAGTQCIEPHRHEASERDCGEALTTKHRSRVRRTG